MPSYIVTVTWRDQRAAPQQLYLLDGDLTPPAVEHLANELLHDAVVQDYAWQTLESLASAQAAVLDTPVAEIAYKPGVTDNEAESIRIGAERIGVSGLRTVRTLRRYQSRASDLSSDRYNPLIQLHFEPPTDGDATTARLAFYTALLRPPAEQPPHIASVTLCDASDDELQRISRDGILALDLEEMRTIAAYFRSEGREPTDGELETLAQTWSEHCSHKTFKAKVQYQGSGDDLEIGLEQYAALQQVSQGTLEIDSLIKTFLMAATTEVLAQPGKEDWVLSAFVDNAGILAFGEQHEISFKVETHNHPSALEPFGGANTGVGGVVRDVLGVSAQPIANTDVLCFGPLDLPDAQLASSVLPPRMVAAGVVAGVRDYGNKLGIPTVNGAVLYDPGYVANPLVFCGTLGLAPRGRHPRQVHPGDAVVVLGGRTGRDGIHGATFSSVELTHTTAEDVGTAVQIGDPITEKKVLDVILQARDAGLYSAITDCGAGGLSSAVGEMGEETGVRVILDDVPLKYAGLQPWEIWLSEAQERMVLSVPPEHLEELLALCAGEDVEATVIGQFTGDGRLTVTHRDATVVDLAMSFVHGGRPQRLLTALWQPVEDGGERVVETPTALLDSLLGLLAHPNIASKEPIIRTYDHEVLGHTVIKPLVGEQSDGPGDAAVLQPLRATTEGVALGSGINPRYGEIDPYWMALACVDEALRNAVAVGGDPRRTAVLDNFCWGDPKQPDRMAGLVRAAAGCYDAALAYGAPFISGKDSLNNEYRDDTGRRTPIPPTLLISALAHVPDVRRTTTMDLKTPGNALYLLGLTKDELLGSHYALQHHVAGSALPKVDLTTAPALLTAVHTAISQGLVRSAHDLSEGGLAVAAAEMAFAGGLGLQLDLSVTPRAADVTDDQTLLFSESPTRLLLEVPEADRAAFEALLSDFPVAQIGTVTETPELVIRGLDGTETLRASLDLLKQAWQGTVVV